VRAAETHAAETLWLAVRGPAVLWILYRVDHAIEMDLLSCNGGILSALAESELHGP
jgi:hypothetical protein